MAKRKIPARWTDSQAKRVLDEADRSGQSDRAFGRQRGVDPQRLSYWRQRLDRKRERVSSSQAFVELSAPRISAPATIEIQLTNGRVVMVPPTIDPAILGELLDAIEGRRC